MTDTSLIVEAGDSVSVNVDSAGPNTDVVVTIGTTGTAGQGVPTGGTTGQVLAKASATNYDTTWVTGGGGSSAWADITGKPSTFTPSTHAASHGTGGADAITPASIGAAGESHGHGSITSDGLIGGVTVSGRFVTTSDGGELVAAGASTGRTLLGLGGAATLNVGTAAGTVAAGNDSRLSDARTPTAHGHGNLTNAGAIGSTSGLPVVTGASGVLAAGSFGTAAGSVCQGDDSRLSDARTPTTHAHGNITNAGAIGTTPGQIVVTTTSGVLTTAATIASTAVSGLGGAATLNVGTAAGTVAAGNDSRLSDARTPTAHGHGNIANAGTLASGTMTASSVGGPVVFDTLAGAVARGAFGTAAGEVCQGNDSRLSDTRTPTSHVHGNISNAGAIGSTAGQIVVTTTSGVLTTAASIASSAVSGLGGAATLNVGTAAGTVAAGDDSRMANTRTPTDGTVTTAKIVDANVTIAKLSATGTASSSTFLRGDGAWATAGSTSASDLTSGTLPEGRLPNLVILHPFLLAGM